MLRRTVGKSLRRDGRRLGSVRRCVVFALIGAARVILAFRRPGRRRAVALLAFRRGRAFPRCHIPLAALLISTIAVPRPIVNSIGCILRRFRLRLALGVGVACFRLRPRGRFARFWIVGKRSGSVKRGYETECRCCRFAPDAPDASHAAAEYPAAGPA